MRRMIVLPMWCVTGVLVAANLIEAQQPAQPPPPAGGITIDQVLVGWEKAMTSIQSLYVEDLRRTTLDKVFGTKETFAGKAMYLKSNAPGQGSRASLEMQKETPQGLSQTIFEKYICSGTFLYEYAPANKVIRIHNLPKPQGGQIADDNFLAFLFGMKAAQAKQRYFLALEPPPDQFYFYVKVQAKEAADKADFTQARLVLTRDKLLPRQVWFHQPNGNEVTWDFNKVQSGIDIPPALFGQPQLPAGWQWERTPADMKPKVRSAGQ